MVLEVIWRFIHKSWLTEFQVSDNPGYRISQFAITHIKIQCVMVIWFAIFIWLHFNFNASLTYLLHVVLCIFQFLSWLLCLKLSKTTLEQNKANVSKYSRQERHHGSAVVSVRARRLWVWFQLRPFYFCSLHASFLSHDQSYPLPQVGVVACVPVPCSPLWTLVPGWTLRSS